MKSGLKFFVFFLALGAWSLAPSAACAVPQLLSYQGILKDSSGNYLTGTYSIQFKIYSASTGGTALWTETQSSVSAASGKFNVQLGSVTTLDLDFDQDYWLSIKVGSDSEMTPRIRLTSAGYAYMAENVVNSFTEAEHDALSHKNIEGVKDNTVMIAKTNFKLDAYALAVANSLGDMVVDTFTDASGIASGSSSNYTWRTTPNYDVIVTPSGGSAVQSNTSETDMSEILSNNSTTYNGFGQQFQHGSAVTVDRVGFKWQRVGSPTGNVRIRLYASSSGVPGTLLAESADISVAGVSTSYEEVTASLGSAVALSANTEYIVVVENTTGSGDGSNHINVRRSSDSNPYANGSALAKNSSSTWATFYSGYDTYFKVYEQPVQSGTATVISTAYTEPSAPTTAMVIADETLNGETIVYSVSRDNGTTWTTCTKETICNISSQPSGTQLKWKAQNYRIRNKRVNSKKTMCKKCTYWPGWKSLPNIALQSG